MAEAYLNKRIQEENLEIEVKSAGTLGYEGLCPTKEVLLLLEEEKIRGDGYCSKALTPEVLEWADLILVMEPRHREAVKGLVSDAEKNTKYLREFDETTDETEIPDPIGRPLDIYKNVFGMIKRPIEGWIKWIKE